MDELLRFIESGGGQGDQVGVVELCIALGLSLLCTLAITWVYRYTHRAASYSQSYVVSLVLMGLVTTLIMIVIGSNIARAFSLVGALSIIRFRNAVKETRDVAHIYYVMAIAMACGTRFYALAVVATVITNAVLVVLYLTDYGASRRPAERLLTVQLRPGLDPEQTLSGVLDDLFERHAIISVENVRQGLYTEVVLSVAPKPGVTGSQVLDALSRVNDNLKISYHYSTTTDEL